MKTMKLTFYIHKDCIEETHNLNPDIFWNQGYSLASSKLASKFELNLK